MSKVKELYKQFPALFVSFFVALVIGVAQSQGWVVDEESATNIVAEVLFILLGGAAIHRRVTPVADDQVGFRSGE